MPARVTRNTPEQSDSSSGELSANDVNQIQEALSKVMSVDDAKVFTDLLRKFGTNATSEESAQGAVSLYSRIPHFHC